MDRPLRRLFLFFALLFVALILQLTYVQVWAAPDLKTNPANTRAVAEQMKLERGVIVSADGVELAVNRQEGEFFLREYPQGDLVSPWLGYNHQRYGRAGVERVYNEELSGQSGLLGITGYWNELLGKTRRGADLKLSINMGMQRVAVEALGQRKGAVVALDPRTGAVLAMTTYPRYDPNRLAELWSDINSNDDKPLLNRAIQGLYPPGSVFKTVVAAAGLETQAVVPETTFVDTGSVAAGGFVVNNYGGNVYGEHDFTRAFASSINTTFAKLGVSLGADTLATYASEFGFGKDLPWPLGGVKELLPGRGRLGQGPRGSGGVWSRRSARHASADGFGRLRSCQWGKHHEALLGRPGAHLSRPGARRDRTKCLAEADLGRDGGYSAVAHGEGG